MLHGPILESSQTSTEELISSKYEELVIKEASGECIPDLFDYEDMYPT